MRVARGAMDIKSAFDALRGSVAGIKSVFDFKSVIAVRSYEVLKRGTVPNDRLGITIGDKRYRARRFSLSARPAHPERQRSLHSENDSASERRRF